MVFHATVIHCPLSRPAAHQRTASRQRAMHIRRYQVTRKKVERNMTETEHCNTFCHCSVAMHGALSSLRRYALKRTQKSGTTRGDGSRQHSKSMSVLQA